MKKKGSSALIAMVVIILVISVSSFSLVKVMKPADKIKTSILKSEVDFVTNNGYTLYDPIKEVVTLQMQSEPDSSCTLVDIFITYNDGSQTMTRQFAPDPNANKRFSFNVAPYLAEKYPISVYAVPYCFIDGEWVYGERTIEIPIPSRIKEEEFYEGINIESAQQDVTVAEDNTPKDNGWCEGADINRDGVVDSDDQGLLDVAYGRKDCSPQNNWCDHADLDKDGDADGFGRLEWQRLFTRYKDVVCFGLEE